MSGADFLKGMFGQILNDRQEQQRQAWEMKRQQQALDVFKVQAEFRAALEQEYSPPDRRMEQTEGGLMQVAEKWNPKTQSFDRLSESPVPLTPTGKTINVIENDDKVTYEVMNDGTRREISRGNAFSPRQRDTSGRSLAQTANSEAVDRRFDIKREDSARAAAIEQVRRLELSRDGAREVKEMGGRAAAIEKMQRQFLGVPEPTNEEKAAGTAAKVGKFFGFSNAGSGGDSASGSADTGLMGTVPGLSAGAGAEPSIEAKSPEDIAAFEIMKRPDYERAPIGKVFTHDNGTKLVKTERGLEPAGGANGGPPVAGAQKAPDGKWYVQINGQWNLVEE